MTTVIPLILAALTHAETPHPGLPAKIDVPRFALQEPERAPRANAIATTLTAMQDGNEVGTLVHDAVLARKVRIEFRAQKAASELVEEEGQAPVITLRADLPLYPRVLGPLIAREASRLMYETMIESAEKEYIRVSLQVRTWLELGGEAATLPVIEPLTGYADASLADDFGPWLKPGSEAALHEIGRRTGTEIIPVLQDSIAAELQPGKHGAAVREVLEKIKAALESDNKRFVDFLIAENEWRRVNAGRLR